MTIQVNGRLSKQNTSYSRNNQICCLSNLLPIMVRFLYHLLLKIKYNDYEGSNYIHKSRHFVIENITG